MPGHKPPPPRFQHRRSLPPGIACQGLSWGGKDAGLEGGAVVPSWQGLVCGGP